MCIPQAEIKTPVLPPPVRTIEATTSQPSNRNKIESFKYGMESTDKRMLRNNSLSNNGIIQGMALAIKNKLGQ